ncbi:MAG: hypothetical protein AAFZ15_17960 [Bacteroidota bacterium]
MKKVFLGIVLLSLFSLGANAQRDNMRAEMKEKVEAYKIAFFTEKLDLSPDESKTFWPLFNELENKQEALREKYHLKGKKLELLSDAEVKDHIMSQLDMEQEAVQLRKDYTLKFMDVLPVRKVAMLQKINREFKKELLREMRQRRQNRRSGGN